MAQVPAEPSVGHLLVEEFSRLISGERVTVVVGTGSTSRTFELPQALLVTEPFFAGAFKRDAFKEGIERKVSLPEDDPAAFELFQYRLFNKSLRFEDIFEVVDLTETEWEERETRLEDEFHRCIKGWVFGDKYCMKGLQNAVMGRLVRTLVAECIACHFDKDAGSLAAYMPLFSYDGLVADVLAAQKVHRQAPLDFPRYGKPVKFQSLFYVDNCEDDKTVYLNWYPDSWTVDRKPECVDCMENYDSACTNCGGHDDDRCPKCSADYDASNE